MKVEIFSSLLLSIAATASAVDCTDCCTTIGDLPFKDLPLCTPHDVLNAVGMAITADGINCPHNRDAEARKLTGTTTTADALNALVDVCKQEIVPCTSLDALDLGSVRHCLNSHWARVELREKMVGCTSTRHDWQEAILITQTDNWQDAEAALLDACYDKITPCVKYADLVEGMKVAADSHPHHCVTLPILALMDDTCEREWHEDAIAMVYNLEKATDPDRVVVWHDDNDETTNAQDYLVAKCEENLTPCLPNTDELFNRFSSVVLCDSHRVLTEIDALHGDDCLRQHYQDAVLLAPDEYTVWHDDNPDTLDAHDYMIEQCTQRITPCASLDELLSQFESIPSCTNPGHIRNDINALRGDSCERSPEWDAVLLAKELILRENSGATEFPTTWYSNDPSVLTGFSVLRDKCETIIKPCVQEADLHLGFITAPYCDQNHVRHEIETKQDSNCRRNPYDDAILLTPDDYSIWGDNNNLDTKDARIHLMNECSQRIEPSFELSHLESDFVGIEQCKWGYIRKAIEVRQSGIPSTRRNPDADGILLAGEVLKGLDATTLITTEKALAGELGIENPGASYAVMSWSNDDEGTYNIRKVLNEHCKERIERCVSDLQAFDEALVDIPKCDHGQVLKLIDESRKEGCNRPQHFDAALIARDYELNANPDVTPPDFMWGGNVLERNAAEYLVNGKCLEKIESCIPSLDLLDFNTLQTCNYGHIQNLIRDNQKEGCKRDASSDAILVVRDFEWQENPGGNRPALRAFWDDDPDSTSVQEYLVAKCHEEAAPCVPSYDDLNFEDINYCDDHHLRLEISSKQPDTCSRRPEYDATFLVRSKLKEENSANPDYEAPLFVWRDNNPDTNDAADYLLDDCESSIVPCSEIEDLDFKNIEFCNEHYIRAEVLAQQDGCSSERHPHYDAMIMTETDVWRDGNPDTTDALDVLVEECEANIEPCVSMETLDFRYIRNCDDHHIRLLIDETRESMGDSCPSFGTRNVLQESILITGADVYHDNDASTTNANEILVDYCLTKVESCTLKSTDALEVKGCDWMAFQQAVKQGTREDDCRRQLDFELYALNRELLEKTGSTTQDLIDSTCTTAWSTIETSTYDDIDSEFTPQFMDDYTNGLTHLNSGTGNFQGRCVYGRDGVIGKNINDFRMYEAEKTVMQGIPALETCEGQAIMCCFGRDRQFGDNNGNCHIDNCEDADPADNSNLCKTDTRAYPNNEPPENEIHCHGLAWGEDDNDFYRKLMFNNFFYVSLYDHMYTRGYVERTIRREDDPAEFRMCDCIEKMNPVSRSDCTEVDINPFTVVRDSTSGKLVATAPESLDIQFNSCRGDGRGNDLSTHIKRLVREGRFSEALQTQAYEVLVGYDDPNDNHNEAACTAAL